MIIQFFAWKMKADKLMKSLRAKEKAVQERHTVTHSDPQ